MPHKNSHAQRSRSKDIQKTRHKSHLRPCIQEMMDELPKDPFMLMSFINMKLRDYYSNLDELCEDLGVEREVITTILGSIGMEYNPETNKFW